MRFLLGVGFCLLSLQAFAQEKCAFVPFNKHLSEISGETESEASFEKWMLNRQQQLRSSVRTAGTAAEARYIIPVVVHVVHRQGEAVGEGANIPEAQILSQLKILNDDFRALNQADINKLSPQFKSLVADTEIEFVLAKQDPEGVETNGIVRIASSQQSWSQSDDLELKALSQWPPDQYLNLYAASLTYPTLGWAQFPQSNELEGLNFGDVSEASDGVVIDYRYVGTGGQAASDSKGRTATHEIGHYFGLRHIWGDGGCSIDDYVSDTPLVGDSNQGCPAENNKPKACNSNEDAMYQNYMDYSGDACMALFTLGQKERMHVVLQNSPRRKELHNSPGKQAPTVVANDAGLRQLALIPAERCNSTYTPNLEVRNYGNTKVTQVAVALSVDGRPLGTYTRQTSLNYLDVQTIALDPIIIENPGPREVIASITLTNNTEDGKSSNNTVTTILDVPQQTNLPLSHDFEGGFFPFYVINPNVRTYTWELKDVPNSTSSNNTAAFINFFDYGQEGHRDILVSPVFDLSEENYLFVSMSVAHARYDRTSTDGLEIYVATDCSTNLQTADLVYSASGDRLATTSPTTQAFVPEDATEWRSIGLDLSAYAGLPNIQLLIVSVNDYGNNLYLDDIQISNVPVAPLNLSLQEVLQPSAVFGHEDSPLQVRIKNSGSEVIESIKFRISLNSEPIHDISLSQLALEPLTTRDVTLATLTELPPGPHVLEVLAYSPNGGIDAIGSDDLLVKQ
ncbi:MAG: zinc metalloprotease, partial [Bacteroidetes bacterium]|nr:zinc metalloprotease [Bacteroidota bacterium]